MEHLGRGVYNLPGAKCERPRKACLKKTQPALFVMKLLGTCSPGPTKLFAMKFVK